MHRAGALQVVQSFYWMEGAPRAFVQALGRIACVLLRCTLRYFQLVSLFEANAIGSKNSNWTQPINERTLCAHPVLRTDTVARAGLGSLSCL